MRPSEQFFNESAQEAAADGFIPCCTCGGRSEWRTEDIMTHRDGSTVEHPDAEAQCHSCMETATGVW